MQWLNGLLNQNAVRGPEPAEREIIVGTERWAADRVGARDHSTVSERLAWQVNSDSPVDTHCQRHSVSDVSRVAVDTHGRELKRRVVVIGPATDTRNVDDRGDRRKVRGQLRDRANVEKRSQPRNEQLLRRQRDRRILCQRNRRRGH